MQIPWGEKADFQGVIDLLTMKAYKGDGKTVVDIPADLKDAADEARLALVEAAAEGEDALLEKYLENGELSNEEVIRGLKAVVRNVGFVPVFATAATAEIGLARLLDAMIELSSLSRRCCPGQSRRQRRREELPAEDCRPAGRLRLENHRRSICRQADIFPGIFRYGLPLIAGFGTPTKTWKNVLAPSAFPAAKRLLRSS